MITALLDGNVLDWLAARQDELQVMVDAQNRGELVLIKNHVMDDEMPNPAQLPDAWARKNEVRQQLTFQSVPSPVFVLDYGHHVLDSPTAQLGTDEQSAIYDTIQVGNPKHIEDAILAVTAEHHGVLLITTEARKLPRRARRAGIEVMHPEELIDKLRKGDTGTSS